MKMTKEEAIAQIEKLKSYCEYMKDSDENGAYVFDLDVQALDFVLSVLIQPNEALTLEELENMEDTTPVWWDQINSWVLVYKGNLTTWSGKHLYAKGCNGKFYRRPPDGEKEKIFNE